MAEQQSTKSDRPFSPGHPPGKRDVGIETFLALDLRVGQITRVEPFPEARKPAWKLTVDFGPSVGYLSTSAQVTNYSLTELLGRLVVGAINLGPKKVAGFKSDFLMLGALTADGTVRLLEVSEVDPGAPVA